MSQITGVSSMATRGVLADLAAAFEGRTGQGVAIRAMGGVEAARRVRAGEPADVVVLASGVMETLEAEGHLVPGSRVGVARSSVAVAVPMGARRPDLGDEDSVRRAMLEAPRICYSTGPSGDHLLRLWERWGIGDAVAGRAIQAPPGVPVAAVLARREADLGFQQLSELLNMPGIDVVGPLPPAIQAVTVFAASVSATSPRREAAGALVAYLASPETEAAKRRHGMEPA